LHYTKPLDYSKEAIDEIQNKWSQVENAYFELKYRIDKNVGSFPIKSSTYNLEFLKSECDVIYDEFEKFLEDNLNFANASTCFFKFINKINTLLVTADSFTKELATFAFKILEKFMYILGLKITEVSEEEKPIIEKLIESRNTFRKNKNYVESDKIRKELLTQHNIELIDHKDFTVWKKIK
jgi:cysteinyl-tRNA synthetase